MIKTCDLEGSRNAPSVPDCNKFCSLTANYGVAELDCLQAEQCLVIRGNAWRATLAFDMPRDTLL